MDKEQPQIKVTPRTVLIRLTPCSLPGTGKIFRASIPHRPLVDIDELAGRLAENGSSLRKETLVLAYRMMTNEIYKVLEEGGNVDIGLGKVELQMTGHFDSDHERYIRPDEDNHLITVFRPSPRLRQTTKRIPVEVVHFFPNAPRPADIGTSMEPNRERDVFNTLPEGYQRPVFIHGNLLKLMGDHADVGLVVRCLDNNLSYRLSANDLIHNLSTCLSFLPPVPFSKGEWEIEITTQFNRSYRLYKQPRSGSFTFRIQASAPLPDEGVQQ